MRFKSIYLKKSNTYPFETYDKWVTAQFEKLDTLQNNLLDEVDSVKDDALNSNP